MSKTLPRLLTVQEVAKWLGVHPMTIYRKAAKGLIPAVKIGKAWLFAEDVLGEWIKSQMKIGGMPKEAGKEKVPLTQLMHANAHRFASLTEIQLLYLFGSQATGATTPLSDIDVAYLDDRSSSPFDLEAKLEACVLEIVPNATRIDLVCLNSAPVAIQYRVIRDGSAIYVRSHESLAAFEEGVITRYLDYSPVLDHFYADAYKDLKEAS